MILEPFTLRLRKHGEVALEYRIVIHNAMDTIMKDQTKNKKKNDRYPEPISFHHMNLATNHPIAKPMVDTKNMNAMNTHRSRLGIGTPGIGGM
jgi:hypothetical protein